MERGILLFLGGKIVCHFIFLIWDMVLSLGGRTVIAEQHAWAAELQAWQHQNLLSYKKGTEHLSESYMCTFGLVENSQWKNKQTKQSKKTRTKTPLPNSLAYPVLLVLTKTLLLSASKAWYLAEQAIMRFPSGWPLRLCHFHYVIFFHSRLVCGRRFLKILQFTRLL